MVQNLSFWILQCQIIYNYWNSIYCQQPMCLWIVFTGPVLVPAPNSNDKKLDEETLIYWYENKAFSSVYFVGFNWWCLLATSLCSVTKSWCGRVPTSVSDYSKPKLCCLLLGSYFVRPPCPPLPPLEFPSRDSPLVFIMTMFVSMLFLLYAI